MVKFVCAENSRFAVTRFYNRDSFYKCFDFVWVFVHLLIYFAYMEYLSVSHHSLPSGMGFSNCIRRKSALTIPSLDQ